MKQLPLFQQLEDIYFEEGGRVAAVAEELTIDGWDPRLHIMAYIDPAVTQYPRDWVGAAEWTNRWYRLAGQRFASGKSQSPWWAQWDLPGDK
jgi:hypothetical protein